MNLNLSTPDMITIAEKVFSGDMENKDPVAEIFQVIALKPFHPSACCCFTIRTPIRNSVKSFGTMQNAEVLPAIALLPALQSGLIAPPICFFWQNKVIARASGSCCDCGRYATFTRMTFEEAISTSEATTGGAPGVCESDEKAPLLSDVFKTDEQLAALPKRKTVWGFYEVVQQQPRPE